MHVLKKYCSVVVVMVDAANKHTRERLDRNIVRILQANRHIPSMLVLNKVKGIM